MRVLMGGMRPRPRSNQESGPPPPILRGWAVLPSVSRNGSRKRCRQPEGRRSLWRRRQRNGARERGGMLAKSRLTEGQPEGRRATKGGRGAGGQARACRGRFQPSRTAERQNAFPPIHDFMLSRFPACTLALRFAFAFSVSLPSLRPGALPCAFFALFACLCALVCASCPPMSTHPYLLPERTEKALRAFFTLDANGASLAITDICDGYDIWKLTQELEEAIARLEAESAL